MIKLMLTAIFILGLLGLGIAIGLLITPDSGSISSTPTSQEVIFEPVDFNEVSSKTLSCPPGKKVVYGTCNPDENSNNLFLVGFGSRQSKPSLKGNDVWQCVFKSIEPGAYKYTISVFCA